MGESRLAALFLTILAAGTAMVVTMVALLVQFQGTSNETTVWSSLVVALSGAGIGLCVTAVVHLSLVATRRSVQARRETRVATWTQVWCAVASGAAAPKVRSTDQEVAAEGAALVLQDLTGEGADRIKQAMLDNGLITAELSLATRGLLSERGASTAALERLAWIAVPEALPLFEVAAGSSSERASRAALLGVMRVLADQWRPEEVGDAALLAVEEHVGRDAHGAKPYLTAVMLAAGDNLAWLCREILEHSGHECVRVAALDAMGRSQRPEAADIATTALLGGAQGEIKAAALRTLAGVGHVPRPAVSAVVAAVGDDVTAVRVHAAYALVGVEPSIGLPTLWHCLADRAWEVRRASADALLRCGRPGEEVLRGASMRHDDKFARDVSSMVLGDVVPRPMAAAPAKVADDPTAARPELHLIGDVVIRGVA